MNKYPRETIEYWFFPTIAVDGVATTSYKYAVTPEWQRPPDATAGNGWVTTATVDGQQAFLLDGLRARGLYYVWVLVDDQDEHVVLEAGSFQLE